MDPLKDATSYPMRINRYLALKGYATRREADALIEGERVLINGRLAELGDKVAEGDDVVVKSGGSSKIRTYFAYNKPRGVITHSPQGEETDIKMETAKFKELEGAFPVGRLDKDSYGLIILTTDGRITDRLLNPVHTHTKEYEVKTARPLPADFKEQMERGVDIGDYVTQPCVVTILGKDLFAITLTEGKKHQIRRMVAALHNDVEELKRTKIMNIELGGLAPGTYRVIEGEELSTFLKSLGL
jgi:23S rRNA pseudouridine2604 synthase